jgi:hypothetical protein
MMTPAHAETYAASIHRILNEPPGSLCGDRGRRQDKLVRLETSRPCDVFDVGIDSFFLSTIILHSM